MGTMGTTIGVIEPRSYAQRLFVILATVALLATHLVAFGAVPASAATTCDAEGFPEENKLETDEDKSSDHKYEISDDWGSVSWVGEDAKHLTVDINEGWQVEICVKAGNGNDGTSTYMLDSDSSDLSFEHGISHVSWRIPEETGDGQITVAKQVNGDGEAPDGDFSFALSCDGTNEPFTLSAGADTGDQFTRTGGYDNCTVTETEDHDADSTTISGDVDASDGDPLTTDTFSVSEDETVSIIFTNTFNAEEAELGDLEVIKDVTGDLAPEDATFDFTVACGEEVDEAFSLGDDGTELIENISADLDCTVTETDIDENVESTTVDVDGADQGETNSVTVDITDDATTTVTFTNDYGNDDGGGAELGDLEVIKDVTGDLAPEDATFDFTVACGEEVDETFSLGDDGTELIENISADLDCTVTETAIDENVESTTVDVDGADQGETNSVTVDITDDATTTVTFTNDYGNDEVTTFTPEPDIELTKTVDPEEIEFVSGEAAEDAFDVIYTFEVENTGNVSLFDVELDDDHLGDLTQELRDELGSSTLGTNDTVTFEVEHTLTEQEIAAGGVTNVATVIGTRGDDTYSDDDDATVTVTEVAGEIEVESAISITKTVVDGVDENGNVTIIGDGDAIVSYSYLITNEGGDELTDFSLVDDKINGLTGQLESLLTDEYGTPALPVGESVTLVVDQTVSADDFDEDELVNIANVTATGAESEDEATDSDDATVGLIQVRSAVQEQEPEDEENEPQVEASEDGDVEVMAEVQERLPRTGMDSTNLLLLGLLFSLLGAAGLLLAPNRRGGSGMMQI